MIGSRLEQQSWYGTKRCFKFHFRKEISHRWGEGLTTSKTCTTREIQPQQAASRQPQWSPAAQVDPQGQRRNHHGAQKRRVYHGAQENVPMQPRQRQKTLEYSSTISPYNMDRTARIKATSNLAAQTDSFQDHLISRYFSGTAPLHVWVIFEISFKTLVPNQHQNRVFSNAL